MRAEELALECVRAYYFDTSTPPHLESSGDELLRIAKRHRIECALAAIQPPQIPSVVYEKARATTLSHVQTQLLLRATLENITSEMRSAGFPFLVFKGLALQDRYYNEKLRPHADIDLLCDEKDISQVVALLSRQGFAPGNGPTGQNFSSGSLTLRDAGGVEVDLHTCVSQGFISNAASFKELYARRDTMRNSTWDTLGHVDHFLAVLLHGCKHHWCRVQFLVDVAFFLERSSQEEILEMRDRVRSAQISRIVSIGVSLTEGLLGAHYPLQGEVFTKCAKVERLVAEYRNRLFLPLRNTLLQKISNACLHVTAVEGVRGRIDYLTRRVSSFRNSK